MEFQQHVRSLVELIGFLFEMFHGAEEYYLSKDHKYLAVFSGLSFHFTGVNFPGKLNNRRLTVSPQYLVLVEKRQRWPLRYKSAFNIVWSKRVRKKLIHRNIKISGRKPNKKYLSPWAWQGPSPQPSTDDTLTLQHKSIILTSGAMGVVHYGRNETELTFGYVKEPSQGSSNTSLCTRRDLCVDIWSLAKLALYWNLILY